MAPARLPQTSAHTQDPSAASAAERLARGLMARPAMLRGMALAALAIVVVTFGTLTLRERRAAEASAALTHAFALLQAPLAEDAAAARAAREARAARRQSDAEERARDGQDDDGDDGDDDEDPRDDDDGDDGAMQALGPDGQPVRFATAAARAQAAQQAFAQVALAHPGPLGAVATLEAAALAPDAHIDDAELGQALERAQGQLSDDDSLMPLLAIRAAQRLEAAGDSAGALQALERIVQAQTRFLGDEAQLRRARLLMQSRDLEGARTALELVQTSYPGSQLQDEVRIALGELEALERAARPGPAAAAG